VLRTRRLRLTPFTRDDVAFLHQLWTDAAVRRFLWDDRVIDRDEATAVVEASLDSFRQHGFGMWVVHAKPDDAPIGFCGLRHFGEPPDDVEVLYGMLPAYWGRGLATEAARVVLRAGFDRGLPRIFAGADPPNVASIQVMKRLGMCFAETRVIDGRDATYFAIEAAEFDESPSR
jgi:RimJ/RimL family protein N-acetyltransferase